MAEIILSVVVVAAAIAAVGYAWYSYRRAVGARRELVDALQALEEG